MKNLVEKLNNLAEGQTLLLSVAEQLLLCRLFSHSELDGIVRRKYGVLITESGDKKFYHDGVIAVPVDEPPVTVRTAVPEALHYDQYGNILEDDESQEEVQVVNCTPHIITLVVEDGESTTFAPSGMVPRVAVTQEPIDGPLPMVHTIYGAVEGLPEPTPGTWYVVSGLVLAALAGSRPDVIAPDTGPQSAIRDEAGRIVGVKRFTR